MLTYTAMGMTDEVTTCEICGKPELKGTIRLLVQDPDGNVEGEIFAGTTCAGRKSGRPVKDLRSEAKKADDDRFWAAMDVYGEWDARHSFWRTQQLEAAGLRWGRPQQVCAFYGTGEFKNAEQAFLAEYPRVELPTRGNIKV